jgi:hypothetical protein
MEWWERVRMEGQARFVIRSTLWFGLIMTASHDFVHGGIDISTVITSHITGVIVGYVGWWSNESEYKKALIAARVNAATTGQIRKP